MNSITTTTTIGTTIHKGILKYKWTTKSRPEYQTL